MILLADYLWVGVLFALCLFSTDYDAISDQPPINFILCLFMAIIGWPVWLVKILT
jgi:hypothetical protein